MNRDKLTLLGCSGSLMFVLLTSSATNAGAIAPKDSADIKLEAINVEEVNTPVAQENPQHPTQDASDVSRDTTGDSAAAEFGCDCPDCCPI